MASKAAATKAAREAYRQAVYNVLSANAPDVDMYTPQFGRLCTRVRKATNGSTDTTAIYNALETLGMLGRASDGLRGSGDKYWPN